MPITQNSPTNTTSGTGIPINHTINNVSLDWEGLSGTTSYKWQLDYDTDFSSVPSGFEDDTKTTSVRLPTLEPATKYYWRVRATAPVMSPWSDKWTFTTSLDTEAVALNLESPKAGASGVPVKPLLQWSAVADADAYELLISTDVNFSNPSVLKMDTYALPTTAWQCNVSLNHDTAYYWKVRAINGDTRSAWSAVGAFTTESPPSILTTGISAAPSQAPAPPTELSPAPAPAPPAASPPALAYPAPPVPPPAPAPAQLPTTPDWVVYLIGALLLTIILLLIIVMMLVVGTRRP